MAAAIVVTFTHPRSSQTRKAEVGPKTTVEQALKGLVEQGFLDPPSKERGYAVALASSGEQIPHTATFTSAGVKDGDTVSVVETSMGARCIR
jgi:hypothetical protein